MREAEFELPEGYQFWNTMRFVRMGQRDPTVVREPTRLVVARWYRNGPATVELQASSKRVVARVWGEAADEAVNRLHAFLGLHDCPRTEWGSVRLNRRLKPVLGTHLIRSPFASYELLSNVIQQQIAWRDAARIWWRLVTSVGETAPGPFGLRLPLHFDQMRRVPHTTLQRCGITEKRIVTLREVGRLGHRIDDWLAESEETFSKRLQTLPHLGPWTVNHLLAVSMGYPDVVVTGDYTLPHTVAFALAGEHRGTDARMQDLLKPFTGDRWRLVRLFWALNITAPRRGPRMAPSQSRRW